VEFKREAVALANQPGVTKARVGRELDINPNMITRWQRELSANGSKASLGQGVARDEELAENHQDPAQDGIILMSVGGGKACVSLIVQHGIHSVNNSVDTPNSPNSPAISSR